MRWRFRDRRDAGARLAARLERFTGRSNLFVLGLPRGGVPVAAEVARLLEGRLEVLVVRKLGVPGHEELAMGAVACGGVKVLNQDVLQEVRVPGHLIDAVVTAETRELERREQLYRPGRPFPDLSGATVILVDDGVATGSTMLAAVEAVRRFHPAWLVVAAPVMARHAAEALGRVADECEWLALPEPFVAVGHWYEDFSQTSDDEVRQLLAEAPPEPRETAPLAGHR
jgi:predicted phosphoribosyltransferase